MRPSTEMTVSAAMTIAGPIARAATSSAFASARRWTCSLGDSPGKGVSSTAEESTTKEKPASRRISARRVDAEARISFIGAIRREGYYRAVDEAASTGGQVRYEGLTQRTPRAQSSQRRRVS